MPNAAGRGKGAGSTVVRYGKGAGNAGPGDGQIDPMGSGPAWGCSACGMGANFGWRPQCRRCGAPRKRDGAAGGTSSGTSSATPSSTRTFSLAERQLQDMRNAQKQQRKADNDEKRRLRDELARAQAELAANRASPKPQRPAAGNDADFDEEDEDMEDLEASTNEYSAWTEDERQRQVEKAKASIPYATSKFGEESAEVQTIRDAISALQKASRDAKPFKAHRGMLERRRERIRAKLERDEAEVEKIKSEQAALQAKLDGLSTSNEEKKRQLAEVEEELAELVRKALAEGDAAGAAGKTVDEAAVPWSAQGASAAIHALASKPGIPPEFAALLGHVYQAAQALAGAETKSTAAQPGATTAAAAANRQGQQPQPPSSTSPAAQLSPPSPNPGQGAGGSADNGEAGAAAVNEEAGITSATVPTGGLAPQARWARNGAAAGPGGGKGGLWPPTYAAAVGSGSGSSGETQQHGSVEDVSGGGKEKSGTSAAPTGGATAAGKGGSEAEDDDQELVEEEDDGAMQVDSETAASISKLPKADQRRLRAALRARGARDSEGTDAGGGAGKGRDRERSPRRGKEEA